MLAVHQFVLPLQAETFGGGAKTTVLGVISIVGLACAVMVTPLFGMASDRTRSRFGRRRIRLVAATLAAASLLRNFPGEIERHLSAHCGRCRQWPVKDGTRFRVLAPEEKQEMELDVDGTKCGGYAVCSELAPEVFDLDDFGFAVAKSGEVAPGAEGNALEALRQCPAQAIRRLG
nr:ferredoxin [Kibdelosporangium phytohabitans]